MALPAVASALTVLAVGILAFGFAEPGRFSFEMARHLAVMNVMAPLVAIGLASRLPPAFERPSAIWMAAGLQLALLWAWHAPALQGVAADLALLHLAFTAGLGLAAVAFWSLVLKAGAGWNAVFALLVTGKLSCLLGALLLFAPRDLYGLPGIVFALCTIGPSTLADQQLAGLLMTTVCPLSYVVAGTVLAARTLGDLERRSASAQRQATIAPG